MGSATTFRSLIPASLPAIYDRSESSTPYPTSRLGQPSEHAGPALFVEIDASNLREFGSSPEAVIGLLRSFGYSMHRLEQDGSVGPVGEEALQRMLKERGYVDVLFLSARLGVRTLRP